MQFSDLSLCSFLALVYVIFLSLLIVDFLWVLWFPALPQLVKSYNEIT